VAAHAVRSCIDVPPRGVAHVPFAYSAMLYLLLGDVESAQEAIDEYLGLEMPETVICSIEIKYMQLRIALAQGADPNKVLEQLDDLNRKAQECGMALLMLDIHLLEASVQHGLHDRHCAMKSIRKALDLARPEQILRPFLLGGEPVRLLLAEALGAHMGFEVERFVRRIIRAFDDERTRVSQVSSMTMEVPSVRGQIGNSPDFARWNLTIREREVACSLLRGMNRKEIASEFCTSQNTVKSHISHIYEKVGVHSVSELLKMFAEYEVCVN
jgi:DNA-binding CsgD family transcriptional regulator